MRGLRWFNKITQKILIYSPELIFYLTLLLISDREYGMKAEIKTKL